MSEVESTKQPNKEAQQAPQKAAIEMHYARASEVVLGDTQDELVVYANKLRSNVSIQAEIKKPKLLRQALISLYEVVSSDFRYKPKDRSAYMAYQALKKQTASSSLFEARQAYFDWLAENDPDAWMILDPVVSVFPDCVSFEVFSKDEGAYAAVKVEQSAFTLLGDPSYGTTNIDFSQDFLEGIEGIRSYRDSKLSIQTESVSLETKSEHEVQEVIEKKIQVPFSWLRGFLQVQSAAFLEKTHFRVAPLDMYNLLRHLRLNADQKKGGRAIRLELIPGEYPRLVLEPWELVLETSAEVFQGPEPKHIRLWGRRRLKVLAGLLPYAESIDFHVLGSGMPAFVQLKAGPLTFQLALTGFNASNWSQGLAFDLLLPREEQAPALKEVLDYFSKNLVANVETLEKDLKLSREDLLSSLQTACQHGLLMYDLERFYYRPLLDEPLPLDELKFRSRRERLAYDLLGKKNSVTLVSEEHLHQFGVKIVGNVKQKATKEEFQPSLSISEEGRVFKAECSCSFFRKHKLKEGPCEHLIALRIFYGKLLAERKKDPDLHPPTIETRTLTKRNQGKETVYFLSLHQKRLTKRWGLRGQTLKKQVLLHNSVDEARGTYLGEIDELLNKGFVDTRGA